MHSTFRRSAAAVLWLGLLMTHATPAWADSMRCGARLVSTGDSKLEVQSRCGEPAAKSTRTVVVRVFDSAGNPAFVEKQLEEWVYSAGSHRLDQHLTFENGVLVTVRSGDYGG